jgi:hypothetical protein
MSDQETWYEFRQYNEHEFRGYYYSDMGRVAKTMSVCPECVGTRKPAMTILREELNENEDCPWYLEFYYTLKSVRGEYVEVYSDFFQFLLDDTVTQAYEDAVDSLVDQAQDGAMEDLGYNKPDNFDN